MAITRLPLSTSLANYIFEVDLDDVEFRLAFKYNARDDAWYMSIFDTDEVCLRNGIKIVNNWPLLRLWQDSTKPDGVLLSNHVGTLTAPPTLNELGIEAFISYLDAAEVIAIAEEIAAGA